MTSPWDVPSRRQSASSRPSSSRSVFRAIYFDIVHLIVSYRRNMAKSAPLTGRRAPAPSKPIPLGSLSILLPPTVPTGRKTELLPTEIRRRGPASSNALNGLFRLLIRLLCHILIPTAHRFHLAHLDLDLYPCCSITRTIRSYIVKSTLPSS